MARILSDLDLIARKLKGDKWQLVDDLYYHVGNPNSEEVIIVKEDFVTDGASVPWLFRLLIPKDGTYTPCAALHDALYKYKGILPVGWFLGKPIIYSRKRCDEILYESMEVRGVPLWERVSMYQAVRLFGWASWNKKKNKPGRDV